MNTRLVFVHGRAQEHKDAIALKKEWMGAFEEGLAKSNLGFPVPESSVLFPYYGQTLYDLVNDADSIADVIIRGAHDDAERRFQREVLDEVQRTLGIADSEVQEILGDEIQERGVLNWAWTQGILKAIDRHMPGGSAASIAVATRDVYQYLRNPGIRDQIEQGVRKALSSEVPTVVVSHSLGTVVAYNLLRREGESQGWHVPLFVTLGSPLAVTAIKASLAPIEHPTCVAKWFNAMDERDVVALYPLIKNNFDIDPEVENKTDVRNKTANRHGIAGYLDDKTVAARIYEALTR